jgi:hypothetical protein
MGLTTVRQPLKQIGQTRVEWLAAQLCGERAFPLSNPNKGNMWQWYRRPGASETSDNGNRYSAICPVRTGFPPAMSPRWNCGVR